MEVLAHFLTPGVRFELNPNHAVSVRYMVSGNGAFPKAAKQTRRLPSPRVWQPSRILAAFGKISTNPTNQARCFDGSLGAFHNARCAL
jgi:hypothetical protein